MKKKTEIRKAPEINLGKVFKLSQEMIELADIGDQQRQDAGCGVLYGMIRDAAYKIRQVAEAEREAHQKRRAEKGCI